MRDVAIRGGPIRNGAANARSRFLDGRRRDDPRRAAVGRGVAHGNREVVHQPASSGATARAASESAERRTPSAAPAPPHARLARPRRAAAVPTAHSSSRTLRPGVKNCANEVVVRGRELHAVESTLGREPAERAYPATISSISRAEQRARLDVEALARDRRRRDRGRRAAGWRSARGRRGRAGRTAGSRAAARRRPRAGSRRRSPQIARQRVRRQAARTRATAVASRTIIPAPPAARASW